LIEEQIYLDFIVQFVLCGFGLLLYVNIEGALVPPRAFPLGTTHPIEHIFELPLCYTTPINNKGTP